MIIYGRYMTYILYPSINSMTKISKDDTLVIIFFILLLSKKFNNEGVGLDLLFTVTYPHSTIK
jgi:hypothetical protein